MASQHWLWNSVKMLSSLCWDAETITKHPAWPWGLQCKYLRGNVQLKHLDAQLCPGFCNSQVTNKYLVALDSLICNFFCLFLSGLFSAEGSLVKPIPAGLLYFMFSLLMPMERQELSILKHLCCVGLAVMWFRFVRGIITAGKYRGNLV